ncbi:acyltransferase family protein [Schaalia vaccimaxillae]|uniref:acyltransferase family protein n=1 Tax=Schaalia vaccimaxillae TaxID=183916 RepID=UPI0003B70320|nr:acyltransferase [Schaalia vaccimaxillae]
MPARDHSIDIARGIAIIAIVFGHVLRGVKNASLVAADAPWYLVVDRATYMIHLAIFAMAAGLMVHSSVQRRGSGPYLRDRLADFAWVYVIWSVLQGSLQYVLADAVNNGRSLQSVLTLWVPTNQMWFLPWIAVMSVFAVVARPWLSSTRTWVFLVVSAAISIASWGVFGPFIFAQGLGLTFFYGIGVTVGLSGYAQIRERLTPVLTWLGATACGLVYLTMAIFAQASAPTTTQFDRSPSTVALGVVCATAGVVAVFLASILVKPAGPVARLLAYLGRQSMVIFLAHTMALAAVRIVLMRLGFDSAALHLVLGTLGGVAGSLVAWWATRQRLPVLWSAPARLRGRSV